MRRRKFIQFLATAAVAAHISFKSLVPVPKVVEEELDEAPGWNGMSCHTMSMVGGTLFAAGDSVMIGDCKEVMRVTTYDVRRGILKVERG